MSKRQFTIAIDAMGGENSPYKVLKGTELFLKTNKEVNIVLFGNLELIESQIKKKNIKLNNYQEWVSLWDKSYKRSLKKGYTFKYNLPIYKHTKKDYSSKYK